MRNSNVKTVNIHEAKTDLSRLIQEVLSGERVVVARAGIPEVELIPVRKTTSRRKPGTAKGQIWIAPDFDAPLPEEILAYFQK